jgi:hypothetical protein
LCRHVAVAGSFNGELYVWDLSAGEDEDPLRWGLGARGGCPIALECSYSIAQQLEIQ